MYKNVTAAALFACLALAPAGLAQRLELKLDHLAGRAAEHQVVDMDGAQLRALASLAGQRKAGRAQQVEKAKPFLEGVDSLRVYTFEFAKEGQYTEADLDPIRKQLQAPGWSRVVATKEKNESTEVYLMTTGGKVSGLAVVAAEPKELTVVNIAGSIDLARVQELVSSHVAYDMTKLKASEGK